MSSSFRPKGGSLFYKPKPRKKEISRKRWHWPSIILRAVKRTCMAIGAMVLISALISTFMVMTVVGGSSDPALPKDMVLLLKIEDGMTEIPEESSFADLLPSLRPTVKQVTDTIDHAAKDDRVKVLVVNYKGGAVSMTHIMELRDSVKRFRASNKKAYFYTSSFADTGSGVGAYYLASAFDQIWMQPVGLLSISGFSAEVPLAKDALSKAGVKAHFLQREEYKSAMESFTNNTISDQSRQTYADILGTFGKQFMKDVTADRKLKPEELSAAIDKGILYDSEALKAKLIDRLEYGDVLVAELRNELKGDPEDESLELVSFGKYANATDGATAQRDKLLTGKTSPKVALVYVVGAIVPTDMGNGNAAADDIAPAIEEAAKDENIEVIVVRVDSPGGSPSASETIRRAIVKAKERGKKVVVSMGSLAASGGYWLAVDADRIFASPVTLTGSIGVIMGKFEAQGLWEMLGVNWETINWGKSADLWTLNAPFTADQTQRMNTLIDATYDQFLTRVAVGRKMKLDEVRGKAKGRVWPGVVAREIGLVDQLGGLYDTLAYVAAELGVQSPAELTIEILPRPKTPVEQLFELFGEQAQVAKVLSTMKPFLETIAPTLRSVAINARTPMTFDAELEQFTTR